MYLDSFLLSFLCTARVQARQLEDRRLMKGLAQLGLCLTCLGVHVCCLESYVLRLPGSVCLQILGEAVATPQTAPVAPRASARLSIVQGDPLSRKPRFHAPRSSIALAKVQPWPCRLSSRYFCHKFGVSVHTHFGFVSITSCTCRCVFPCR